MSNEQKTPFAYKVITSGYDDGDKIFPTIQAAIAFIKDWPASYVMSHKPIVAIFPDSSEEKIDFTAFIKKVDLDLVLLEKEAQILLDRKDESTIIYGWGVFDMEMGDGKMATVTGQCPQGFLSKEQIVKGLIEQNQYVWI